MSTQMKFCKDCAHHLPSTASSAVSNYDKCAANKSFDLVTGIPTYKYCEYLRRANAECGLEGSLYVPAQQPLPTPEDEAFNALGGSNHV